MKSGRTAMNRLLGVASLLVAATWSTYAQGPRPDPEAAYVQALPDGRGKAELVRLCSQCHALEEVAVASLSRKGWEGKIDEMFRTGASGTDKDAALVRDYLFEIFPARLDINKAITMEFRVYVGLSEKDGDAIVAYRQQHGPFKKWQDLELVPGIDIKKIRERSEILFVDL
jgi:competence ComEA-like helix-hairpin-helix protein